MFVKMSSRDADVWFCGRIKIFQLEGKRRDEGDIYFSLWDEGKWEGGIGTQKEERGVSGLHKAVPAVCGLEGGVLPRGKREDECLGERASGAHVLVRGPRLSGGAWTWFPSGLFVHSNERGEPNVKVYIGPGTHPQGHRF